MKKACIFIILAVCATNINGMRLDLGKCQRPAVGLVRRLGSDSSFLELLPTRSMARDQEPSATSETKSTQACTPQTPFDAVCSPSQEIVETAQLLLSLRDCAPAPAATAAPAGTVRPLQSVPAAPASQPVSAIPLPAMPFKCPLCPRAFSAQSFLDEHWADWHDRINAWICPICRFGFAHDSDLKTHQRNNQHYACTQCSAQFANSALLRKHQQQRKHHAQNNPATIALPYWRQPHHGFRALRARVALRDIDHSAPALDDAAPASKRHKKQ